MKEYETTENIERLALQDTTFARWLATTNWSRVCKAEKFYHPVSCMGDKPTQFHGWAYSETFHQWGALVTFSDGAKYFTWPVTWMSSILGS